MKEYHDQIEAYLRDELSDEDKSAFEMRLNEDPGLREEFQMHQDLFNYFSESESIEVVQQPEDSDKQALVEYFRSAEAQQLKDTLARVKEQQNSGSTSPKSKRPLVVSLLAIAASIALLLVFNLYDTDPSGSQLYQAYHDWGTLPSLTVRQEANDFSAAQSNFEEGRYQESYDLLKPYYKADNTSSSILIYLGVTCLELDKMDEANVYFDQLINSDAVDFSKGYWYKTLGLLKQDKTTEAVKLLEGIKDEKDYYHYDKAMELLERLQ